MKRENWLRLGRVLERRGFVPDESCGHDGATRWFICVAPEAGVPTSLRFVFKPKMHVLTAHLGWPHGAAREFCLTALQADWPRGFAWLKEAGVNSAPSGADNLARLVLAIIEDPRCGAAMQGLRGPAKRRDTRGAFARCATVVIAR